jgi:hypothetical protein
LVASTFNRAAVLENRFWSITFEEYCQNVY